MTRFSGQVLGVGVLLSSFVVAVAAAELIYGERSFTDLAVVSSLAALTAATWFALLRTSGSLDASVAARHELQVRLEQQRAVAQLGQLALTDIPSEGLLDEATRVAATHLRADFAAIVKHADDGFDIVSSVGWANTTRVPCGARSHSGYTFTAGEPVILCDTADETRFELSEAMAAEGVTSGLAVPIGSNGGTYGVISVHTRARRTFSTYDASFLVAVTNVLASALRRHAAEEHAETTHRVLEAVIEGTSDDVFVKDLDGRIVALNQAAAKTLGRPIDELLGRTLQEALPHAVAEIMVENDRETLERGTVETYEETIWLGDTTRVFLATKGPYRARDGTLLGTFGIAHDITQRKQQEQALIQSEERFRLAQEGARMGTWDIDFCTGATTWSDGLRALHGVGPDYPAGFAHLEPLIHPEERTRIADGVTRAYATGEPFEFEFRIVLPDGELRWLLARSSCIRDESGKPVRQLGVAVDITERKLAEEELVRSQCERVELELRLHQSEKLEAVGRLAGGVAHDFNNLLVAISGYGELALTKLAQDEPAREYISSSLVAAERAAGLTKQLLAFARRQVMHPEMLDLNEVVQETGALLDRLIGDQVELVVCLADEPLVVQADRGQLEQVLMNLTVNGRDAMQSGGKLTIRVAADHEGLRALLSVTDEGSGIAPEVSEHIFEPFFTTKGDHGTGLGLATVHGIVAQSGGEIAVESEIGRGTTFTVSLMLRKSAPVRVEAAGTARCADGSELLLLVEDDPDVRMVVSSMLESYGYEVVTASDGGEAVTRFASERRKIPLVLSDLIMRDLDGQQTLERIRAIDPSTKALFMSGYTDGMILRSDVLGDATGFIQKPFSSDQLARRIRDMLDRTE